MVPGSVAIVGGIVLIQSRNRLAAVLGAWLSALAGAWFIVGRAVAEPLGVSYTAVPSTTGTAEAMWIEIANFTGIGAVIMLVAALILGRLSVRSPRDIRYADSTFAHAPVSDEDDGHLEGAASQHTRRRHWTDLFGRRDTTPAH